MYNTLSESWQEACVAVILHLQVLYTLQRVQSDLISFGYATTYVTIPGQIIRYNIHKSLISLTLSIITALISYIYTMGLHFTLITLHMETLISSFHFEHYWYKASRYIFE